MHTLKLASALAAGLLSMASASAATVNLDFSGTGQLAPIGNYYIGGTDGAGNVGVDHNTVFTQSVLALTNGDGLGSGTGGTYFTGAPTTNVAFVNASDLELVANGGTGSFMNVSNGFDTSLTLTYSSISAPTVLNIFSGLNGTGTLLATLNLANNSDGCGTGSPFCVWTTATQSFSGIAESVQLDSNAGNFAFTNVQFNAVPLPASGLLMAFAVAGLSLVGVRRRAA